ncbi:transmembrane protein 17 isoform X2 [Strigops habroptila]|uniref:transmembrane protein 17 isoform X2 n=1 Tax=Strigops habroptila TaxID=2489341 RepID=UPI0011CFCDB5|nr:transmembrane protein 17 isoform X2 [Strigops habroptila]
MSLPEPLRRRLGSFSRTVFTDSQRTGPPYPGDSAVSVLVGLLQVHLGHDHDPNLINRGHSTLPGIHGQSTGKSMLLHVPELAGFWLLTLLLQLPTILFLLFNEGLKIQALERAVNSIFAVFLIFQVIAAFVTLKRMVNKLATHFRLNEFDQLEEQPVPGFYSLGKEEGAVSVAAGDPSARDHTLRA